MDGVIVQAKPLSRPSLGSLLELIKPITWFAPIWAFMCGVVSSGAAPLSHWPLALAGAFLAGPLVCGTSQAVNDWFDREVDAINEPNRPIPSGRVPGRWGLWVALAGTALSFLYALTLGPWTAAAAAAGLALAWAYSAPPLRLKQSGWRGPAAVSFSYEGLAWLTGAAVMLQGPPGWPIVALAVLYSVGAFGIMTLNDFKAEDGDRALGLRSLPVILGVGPAARLACWFIAVPQGVVVGLLLAWGLPLFAGLIAALIVGQLLLMRRLLRDPKAHAPWYNATGTSVYVLGMLVSAIGVNSLAG